MAIPFDTGTSGVVPITFSLPDSPVFYGDLYAQFAYLWPASPSPTKVALTRGLRAAVR